MFTDSRPAILITALPILAYSLFFSSNANASTNCPTPSSDPANDTSAAKVVYWGLNNNANNSQCNNVISPDALPITFPFELSAAAANADNFSFWNAAKSAWEPIDCAQWGPTSGVSPELTSITLFMTTGITPAAGDTIKICHSQLTKNDGTSTPEGYKTSDGWCDNTAKTPTAGQGIGIVSAADNGNSGVCVSPSSGIMLVFSGGARNASVNNGWTFSDIQNTLHVSISGESTTLSPVNVIGDSDTPVPDNYYEICVNYPDGKSFTDITNIAMDTATAYDPHGCANDGTKSWTP